MQKGGVQLVNVRVKDPVHKADAGRFVGILVGQLDVYLPEAALKWRWRRG